MVMTHRLFTGLPVLAIALTASLMFSAAGFAQTAAPAAETPAIDVTAGTGDTPAFQGLIPPAAAVSYGGDKPAGTDTHPTLNLTPDKSELVRLDQDAGSIVVGNPDHLGVLMDNRRLLILVPRLAGATYMTVLDSKGKVIMQRHIIVGSPKSDYIRIRRSCAGEAKGCQPTSVYYCPGMCHPVGTPSAQSSDASAAMPLASYSSSGDDTGGDSAPASAPNPEEAPPPDYPEQ